MPTIKTQLKEAKHRCEVYPATTDTSFLPQLPPQVNHLKKWIHNLRRHFIVSGSNFRTIFVFRSSAMLRNEKRRQIRKYPWYIIHPFSNFYTIVEVIMSFTWSFALIKDPLAVALLPLTHDIKNSQFQLLDLFLDFIQMFHVLISFITGYFQFETKEVILSHKKIINNYMKTYFIFDCLGSVPMGYLSSIIAPNSSDMVRIYLSFFRLARLVRIYSMAHYYRTITNFMRVSDNSHVLLVILIIGIYLLHWFACALCTVPRVYNVYYGLENGRSWYLKADKKVVDHYSYRYLVAFHIIMNHFSGAGIGNTPLTDPCERIVGMFCCVVGLIYVCFALAIILLSVSSSGSSESKYEELLYQLMEYCKRKRLPLLLRAKINLYYEHRFQKHYFKESEILNSVSLNMKYQIILHSCKYLFDKVRLFEGLSKTVLGTIIGSLKNEVFLPGDIIFKTDESENEKAIYFIAYGTVALFDIDNIEITHCIDGDVIGMIHVLDPSIDIVNKAVAVETTDVYKLSEEDFKYCMKHFSDFNKKVKSAVKRDSEMLEHMLRQIKEAKLKKADIIFDLRRRRILEQNKLRRKWNK